MIIIPARLQSTRLPRKVLADIGGIPMVIRTANQVKDLDEIVIATESEEVKEIAEKFGYNTVLTSAEHSSGTERINEAAELLQLPDEAIVVNVQGDEPFIESDVVRAIIDRVKRQRDNAEDIMMASAYTRIDEERARDPHQVKVVLDKDDNALYFSRGVIPYPRDGQTADFKGHLGIYGFTRATLRTFCNLPPAPIAFIEQLEQLRAIYGGHKIAMVEVQSKSIAVDTQQDLERALASLKS